MFHTLIYVIIFLKCVLDWRAAEYKRFHYTQGGRVYVAGQALENVWRQCAVYVHAFIRALKCAFLHKRFNESEYRGGWRVTVCTYMYYVDLYIVLSLYMAEYTKSQYLYYKCIFVVLSSYIIRGLYQLAISNTNFNVVVIIIVSLLYISYIAYILYIP